MNDYKVVYKQGKDKVVADALSWWDEDVVEYTRGKLITCCPMLESRPKFAFVKQLKVEELLRDPTLTNLLTHLMANLDPDGKYVWCDDMLWYRVRLIVLAYEELRLLLL